MRSSALLWFARSRLATLAAVSIVTGAWLAGSWNGNQFWAWDVFGVPPMPPPRLPFTDLISVTHAVDCYRAGLDPYHTGKCDPWSRLLNYPPIWLELRRLGVTRAMTVVLGVAMAGTSVVALLLVFRSETWPGFLLVCLAVLSPAMLFGIERGNVDTLLYAILVLVLWTTARLSEEPRRLGRALVVIVLTVLKAYPVGASAVFLDGDRRAVLRTVTITFAAVAAFAFTAWRHLPLIFANTPLTSEFSFGSAPLFLDLGDWSGIGLDKGQLRWTGAAVALTLALVIAVYVQRSSGNFAERLLGRSYPGRFLDDLALAGAGMFCVTFLLGSNFNYRLVVLAGVVARSVRAFEGTHQSRLLMAPALIVGLFWATRLGNVVDHALNWIVYALMCIQLSTALLRPPAAGLADAR